MTELIFLVEDAIEGGFTAKALGESIFTQADSLDELKNTVRDAVTVHFGDKKLPYLIRLHYVRDEILPIA